MEHALGHVKDFMLFDAAFSQVFNEIVKVSIVWLVIVRHENVSLTSNAAGGHLLRQNEIEAGKRCTRAVYSSTHCSGKIRCFGLP